MTTNFWNTRLRDNYDVQSYDQKALVEIFTILFFINLQLDRPSFGVGSNELGVLLDANGSNKLIRAYRKYMEDVINSLNVNGVAKETIRNDLDELFQFIVHLTQIVTPADEKRDHFSVYKRMTLGELESEHPGVSIDTKIVIISKAKRF